MSLEREKKLAGILLGGAFLLLMLWGTVQPVLTQEDKGAVLSRDEKEVFVTDEGISGELDELEIEDSELEEEFQQLDKELEGL